MSRIELHKLIDILHIGTKSGSISHHKCTSLMVFLQCCENP